MTEEELRYNAPYANFGGPDDGRPGVLRRMYPLQLIGTTFPGETNQTTQNYLPSGRRTRVFALTFSGDVEWWVLSLRSQSGEIFIESTQVATMLNLARSAGTASSQIFSDSATSLYRPNSGPYTILPNIVLQGSQTLVVSGGFDAGKIPNPNGRTVLNIVFHVWEFPNWGPAGTMPTVAPGQPGAPASGSGQIGGVGLGPMGPVGPAAIAQANEQMQRQLITRNTLRPRPQPPAPRGPITRKGQF